MIDPAIARSLELQRHGFRVVVQQEGEVTVYVGRREAPIAEDVRATAGTFALALERAALDPRALPGSKRRLPTPRPRAGGARLA